MACQTFWSGYANQTSLSPLLDDRVSQCSFCGARVERRTSDCLFSWSLLKMQSQLWILLKTNFLLQIKSLHKKSWYLPLLILLLLLTLQAVWSASARNLADGTSSALTKVMDVCFMSLLRHSWQSCHRKGAASRCCKDHLAHVFQINWYIP